jgi:hypothetical protein
MAINADYVEYCQQLLSRSMGVSNSTLLQKPPIFMSNEKFGWGRDGGEIRHNPKMLNVLTKARHMKELNIYHSIQNRFENNIQLFSRTNYKIQVHLLSTCSLQGISSTTLTGHKFHTVSNRNNQSRVYISVASFYSRILVSTWVGEEAVDGWHNFWGLVADKFSQEMLRILLPLSKIVQHSRRPVLLGHPD